MKRLAIAAVLALVAVTASAYTGTYVPGAGINGTPHDLGTPGANGMNYGASPADALQRICVYCHAPHNAYKLSQAAGGPAAGIGGGEVAPDEFTYLPLWNHTLPNPVPTYTMYQNGIGAPVNGPKASQAIANGMTAGNVTLLCLSCHDGSIAVNSYGNAAWQPSTSVSTGAATISGQYQIGRNFYLGNHHPVGFDYDAVSGTDLEIRGADVTLMTSTTTVRDHLFGDGTGSGTSTLLECASCHSVHNKGNTGERLLWRTDQNSELCLTCHDKGAYTAP